MVEKETVEIARKKFGKDIDFDLQVSRSFMHVPHFIAFLSLSDAVENQGCVCEGGDRHPLTLCALQYYYVISFICHY